MMALKRSITIATKLRATLTSATKTDTIIAVFLLSLLLVVFWPNADKEFLLWDDEAVLSQYKPLVPLTWSSIPELATSAHRGEYMPVTKAVWALIILPMQWISGSRWSSENWVQPFILVGILFHFLNCLLIKEILPLLFRNDHNTRSWTDWIPVFLYALHPLHVEGLAATSMLREPLWIFFGLLSIRAYLGNKVRRTFLFFLLASLAKPTSIVLAAFLLLLRLVKRENYNSNRARTVFYFSALFAWVALIGIIAKTVQPTEDFTTTLLQRFIYSADTFGFYLTKLFVPINLSADYGRTYSWLIPQGWTTEMAVFLVVIALSLVLFWRRKQLRTPILLLTAIFFLPLLPVSGVIAFAMQHYSNVADHYAAFSVVAWAGLFYLVKFPDYRKNLVLIPLCVFYGWQSYQQKETWLNNETFAVQTLKINPRSFMAYNNMGLHWLRQGKDQEALGAFKKSIELNPKVINAYLNSVYILNNRGQYDESLALLEESKKYTPKSSNIQLAVASVYEEQGQLAKAMDTYQEAKQDFPKHAGIRYKLGQAYWKQNQFELAIDEFRTAVQLEKNNEKYIETLRKSEKLYEEIKKVN